MTDLPSACVLVRTWFGDDGAWERLTAQVLTPSQEGFLAEVMFVNDHAFEGLTAEALTARQPHGAIVSFIADETSHTDDDHPILAVRVRPFQGDGGRPQPMPFRVVPSELWGVENNINLANMDWQDFTRSVGPDGIFRGF